MKIVELKRIKGAKVNILLSNGESVELDRETALSAGLYKGCSLDEQQLCELLKQSELSRAKNRALWYISRSDCSKKAMYQKLHRAGFCELACEQAVQKLCELCLIDDVKYAERLANSYAHQNCSQREIVAKLIAKQIPTDIAKQAAADIEVDSLAAIRALIDKKYYNRIQNPDKKQNVFAAICRKGFRAEDVKTVMRQYNQDFFDED